MGIYTDKFQAWCLVVPSGMENRARNILISFDVENSFEWYQDKNIYVIIKTRVSHRSSQFDGNDRIEICSSYPSSITDVTYLLSEDEYSAINKVVKDCNAELQYLLVNNVHCTL
jgi:hypothetical protein